MDEIAPPASPPELRTDRLISVTVGEWSGLDAIIALDVAPRRTVLLSKGGPWASKLLEGLAEASHVAVASLSDPDKPRHFRCELETAQGERLSYSYDRRIDTADEDELFPSSIRLEERAERPGGEDLWRVSNRRVVFGDGKRVALPSGVGALALAGTPGDGIPQHAKRIQGFLSGMRWLGANLTRPAPDERQEVVLTGRPGGVWTARGLDRRLTALASTIVEWFSQKPDRFERLAALCGQLRLTNPRVTLTDDATAQPELIGARQRATLTFGGVDFGLLPDGSIRRLESLVNLLDPDVTVLLLDEVESAAPPGALDQMLEIIDAHREGTQLIVSTTSPLVVDWAMPEELRILQRYAGRTVCRALGQAELDKARELITAGAKLSQCI